MLFKKHFWKTATRDELTSTSNSSSASIVDILIGKLFELPEVFFMDTRGILEFEFVTFQNQITLTPRHSYFWDSFDFVSRHFGVVCLRTSLQHGSFHNKLSWDLSLWSEPEELTFSKHLLTRICKTIVYRLAIKMRLVVSQQSVTNSINASDG